MSFTHTYFFLIKYICTVKKYVIYVLPPRNTRNHISSLGCNRPRMRFFHYSLSSDFMRLDTWRNWRIDNIEQRLNFFNKFLINFCKKNIIFAEIKRDNI